MCAEICTGYQAILRGDLPPTQLLASDVPFLAIQQQTRAGKKRRSKEASGWSHPPPPTGVGSDLEKKPPPFPGRASPSGVSVSFDSHSRAFSTRLWPKRGGTNERVPKEPPPQGRATDFERQSGFQGEVRYSGRRVWKGSLPLGWVCSGPDHCKESPP